jgi:hypothetical protein
MGMTADSIAQSIYSQFEFGSSQASQANAVDPSSVSQSEYNIADLSSALAQLGSAADFNPFTTSIDGYVQSSFDMSQLPEYAALSGSASGSANSFLYSTGGINSMVSSYYMQSGLGLPTAATDIDGVTDPETAAMTNYMISKLSTGTTGGSTANSYENYSNTVGSSLDLDV